MPNWNLHKRWPISLAIVIGKNPWFWGLITFALAVLSFLPDKKPIVWSILTGGFITGIVCILSLNPTSHRKLWIPIICFIAAWLVFGRYALDSIDSEANYLTNLTEDVFAGPILKDGVFESGDLLRYWESNERIREQRPISSDSTISVRSFSESKKYDFDIAQFDGLGGTPCLRIINKMPTKDKGPSFIRQRITVEPNSDYRIKFFVSGKIENQEGLRLAIGDKSWESGVRIQPSEITSSGWGNGIEKILKTDIDTNPNFYIISNGIADLHIDNLSIEKVRPND